MDTLRLTVTLLVVLPLAACKQVPSPYRGRPWIGPNGQVVQPPPEGWPDYTRGARD